MRAAEKRPINHANFIQNVCKSDKLSPANSRKEMTQRYVSRENFSAEVLLDFVARVRDHSCCKIEMFLCWLSIIVQ